MRFAVFILLLSTVGLIGADYYAAQSSAGAADGTSYANRWAVSGINWTTVDTGNGKLFLCGSITTRVVLNAHGEEGSPIWIRSCTIANGASTDDPAILTTGGFDVDTFDWVRVDSLSFTGMFTDARVMEAVGSQNLIVTNCFFQNVTQNVTTGSAKVLYIITASNTLVSACVVSNFNNFTNEAYQLVEGAITAIGSDGITVDGFDTVIENNLVVDGTEDALSCCGEGSGGNGIIRSNVVGRCSSYQSTHPDLVSAGGNITMYGNIFFSHESQGFFLENAALGRTQELYNNVWYQVDKPYNIKTSQVPNFDGELFYDCATTTIRLQADVVGTGSVVNCLFWGALEDYGVTIEAGAEDNVGTWNYNRHNSSSGDIISWGGAIYNLSGFQAATAHGDNDIFSTTASFADAAAWDFTLLSTAPEVDAGTATDNTIDRIGVSRPQGAGWDIGPLERVGNSGASVPAIVAPGGPRRFGGGF